MRKVINRTLAILFAFILCTSLFGTLNAQARASDYLDNYQVWSRADSGRAIVFTFDVNATKRVADVGSSTVRIYESSDSGNTWKAVKTAFASTTPELLGHNTSAYTGTYTYYGVAGYQYYADIGIYAGDANGSDSNTLPTKVVTCKN